MTINTRLSIPVFNVVKFIILELSLGILVPLVLRFSARHCANRKIFKGAGWKPEHPLMISWKLYVGKGMLIISLLSLAVGLALEYGNKEVITTLRSPRTVAKWSKSKERDLVILTDRADAEYSLYTDLASKYTSINISDRNNEIVPTGMNVEEWNLLTSRMTIRLQNFVTTPLQQLAERDLTSKIPLLDYESFQIDNSSISIV